MIAQHAHRRVRHGPCAADRAAQARLGSARAGEQAERFIDGGDEQEDGILLADHRDESTERAERDPRPPRAPRARAVPDGEECGDREP